MKKNKYEVPIEDFNLIDFKPITKRVSVSPRGGGIEIDLTTLGYPGESMVAYQNYLGGGLLGRVCSDDSIRARNKIVDEDTCQHLDAIALQLRQHYHSLTNPDEEHSPWEHRSFEQNQQMPESGF